MEVICPYVDYVGLIERVDEMIYWDFLAGTILSFLGWECIGWFSLHTFIIKMQIYKFINLIITFT